MLNVKNFIVADLGQLDRPDNMVFQKIDFSIFRKNKRKRNLIFYQSLKLSDSAATNLWIMSCSTP